MCFREHTAIRVGEPVAVVATQSVQEGRVVIRVQGNKRIIKSNALPTHFVGRFPNAGNPNTIKAQSKTYEVPLKPKLSGRIIEILLCIVAVAEDRPPGIKRIEKSGSFS